MIKLSKSYLIGIVTVLSILLALAKGISLSILWLLPSDGVELQAEKNYKPTYQRVDFSNMLIIAKGNRQAKTKKNDTTISANITNMLLKGLYGKGNKGFAVLALKASSGKTSIISVGEVFSGHTLQEILINAVLFRKNSKEYLLYIEELHPNKTRKSFIKPLEKASSTLEAKAVSRQDIKDYGKNPQKIWNDIGFTEVRKGSKVEGFKVTRVKSNSQIGKLGLLKGDIVMRVNNIEMNSYKHALSLYENIDKISTMQIVVLRNNTQKELIYDIN